MIWDTILLAVRELRRNLMRALLTTLGVVIGVASVIAMVTLGNGATASVTASVGALGQNVLTLSPGLQTGGFGGRGGQPAPPFQASDLEALRREIGNVRAIAPQVQRGVTAVAGNRNATTQAVGTDNDYFIARDMTLSTGRQFSDAEIRSGRGVCVLGETVRQKLFGAQNPVGETIRLGKVPCQVIGVLTSKGTNTFGQDQDDFLLMPLRTVQRRIAGNNALGMMWISASSDQAIPRVISDINLLLRERRHLPVTAPNNFTVQDVAQVAQVLQQITLVLTLFLSSIAGVSLVVGGIGIMNIMLVSVTERTREIGIRLAIGARERDVLLQFLVEAMMMSIMGGVVGILLGLGLSYAATAALGMPYVLSPAMMVVAFVFSGGIGIAFGFFPARRAARLDPIEALRHE
jgi:putative ABC transport system permease protein